jgi:hypothetical protein
MLKFLSVSARIVQGCRVFLTQYTKTGEINQIATKLPNGHKMYKISVIYIPNGPQKFTQIGIFGLKIYHLATLE